MKKFLKNGKAGFTMIELLIGITIITILSVGAYETFGGKTDDAKDSTIANNLTLLSSSLNGCIQSESSKAIPWSAGGTDKDQYGNTIAKTPAYYTKWANNCIKGAVKFEGTIAVDDGGTIANPNNPNGRILSGLQFDTIYGTTTSTVIDTSTDGKYVLVLRSGGTVTNPIYSDIASLGVDTALKSQPLEYAIVYKANFNPKDNDERALVTSAKADGGIAGSDGTAISGLTGKAGTYTNGVVSTGGKAILVIGKGTFDGAY